ncbi:MAG: (d)CMP kinase, partial [bacterium]
GDGFLNEMLRDEMERIRERDLADEDRQHSPLVQAADAIEVNTTELTFDGQVEILLEIVRDLTGTR